MNNRDFLNAVLTEGAPAGFQQTVLRETIRAARQRRRLAAALRLSALTALIALLFLQFRPERNAVLNAPGLAAAADAPHKTIRTLPFANVLRSQAFAPEFRLSSASAKVATINSDSFGTPAINLLTDEQLLSFFQGQPVALVRRGAHEADLLFVAESPR